MRVRPFFWFALAVACLSVLCVSFLTPTYAPVILQVHVDAQHPVSPGVSLLKLHLTDTEGVPIDQAQIIPLARMTNMEMSGDARLISYQGQGDYLVAVRFSMSGPWAVTIQASAAGFSPSQKTLFLQVGYPSSIVGTA